MKTNNQDVNTGVESSPVVKVQPAKKVLTAEEKQVLFDFSHSQPVRMSKVLPAFIYEETDGCRFIHNDINLLLQEEKLNSLVGENSARAMMLQILDNSAQVDDTLSSELSDEQLHQYDKDRYCQKPCELEEYTEWLQVQQDNYVERQRKIKEETERSSKLRNLFSKLK